MSTAVVNYGLKTDNRAVVDCCRDFLQKTNSALLPVHLSPYIIITLHPKFPLSNFLLLKSWFQIIVDGLLERFYTHLASKTGIASLNSFPFD